MWAISGHLEKQLVAIAGEAISGHHDKQLVALAGRAIRGHRARGPQRPIAPGWCPGSGSRRRRSGRGARSREVVQRSKLLCVREQGRSQRRLWGRVGRRGEHVHVNRVERRLQAAHSSVWAGLQGNQRQSEAIKGNQRQSEAIRAAHSSVWAGLRAQAKEGCR